MRPTLDILSHDLVHQIIDEAFELLLKPGIKVQHQQARSMLYEVGVKVDEKKQLAFIPRDLANKALETVPPDFFLFDRHGEPKVHYGGFDVHFDPGSSGVNILDPNTLEHKPSTTQDLINIIKVTESLPQYDAQSTAVVCNDVHKDIGDLYRLYIVLLHSVKPIVTGSFSSKTTQVMIDMLTIFSGDNQSLAKKPQAVFDVCPSPPLIWSEFGCQNLIDLALSGVPAEIVSMPLAGATAPVTLLGSVVQHAAECISGMTIHQLAKAGSPIIWGGAPAIMDMRFGTTPLGAIETAMIDAAYTQVGKSLGFPTHSYMCASDSKTVDVQSGIESASTALIGALAGVNMISGAGMLDFLACQSLEKLVIDAEIIGSIKRLLQGMLVHTDTLATGLYEDIDFSGEFLKHKITRDLIKKEQYLPSDVIDRRSIRSWQNEGKLDAFDRAKHKVSRILSEYQLPELPLEQKKELHKMVKSLANEVGMSQLPNL